jgi:hypothetical protein
LTSFIKWVSWPYFIKSEVKVIIKSLGYEVLDF